MKSRFNLLDLLVLVLLLLGAWHYGRHYFARPPKVALAPYQAVFWVSQTREPTWSQLRPGVVVRDGSNNQILGRVVAVDSRPAVIDDRLPDGTWQELYSRTDRSLWIRVVGTGRQLGTGQVGVGSDLLRVGSPVNLVTAQLAVGTLCWEVRP